MTSYTQSIQNLMNQLAALPGIGMRSAERIAFHLLKQPPQEALKLADAIRDV
jgi:recombination protein RecR